MDKSRDASGRPYAKLSELEPGSVVELDGDFTCRESGETVVFVDEIGPYFYCNEGKHYLSGQVDGVHCIGIYFLS